MRQAIPDPGLSAIGRKLRRRFICVRGCTSIRLVPFIDDCLYTQVVTLNPSEVDAVAFAKAMADDTRQEIMKLLCCQWLSVNDTVDRLGGRVSQPTVSHHLKILEAADLVTVRQDGRQRFYTLNEENFTVCCGLLMTNFAPTYAGSSSVPLIDKPEA